MAALPLPARPDPLPAPRGRGRSSALFVLADGMFFVQSRIGMNDVYVGLFIVAAYTLFAALWTGWLARPLARSGWRCRSSASLLGLALASKWVAAYAIGGAGAADPRPERARAASSRSSG